jgi:hypothetical protein
VAWSYGNAQEKIGSSAAKCFVAWLLDGLPRWGSSKAFSSRRSTGSTCPAALLSLDWHMALLLLRFHCSLLFLSFFLVSASHSSDNATVLYDPLVLQPHPHSILRKISRRSCRPSPPPLPNNCFPAVGFNTSSYVPASTDGWWCNPADEFGFLGFSYEITTCAFPDATSLFSSFRSIDILYFLIRSEFDPTTDRFLKHAKYL